MIADSIRVEVRQRAEFRCELCGISETDSGGELTIDHFHGMAFPMFLIGIRKNILIRELSPL